MSTPININEIGWYLLSVSSNKTIHEAKQEWGILADTIDNIIYELKTPPIENAYNSIYEMHAEKLDDIDMKDLYY